MFNFNVFYRFLAIKLELVDNHKYANQLINFMLMDNVVALI